MWCIVNVCRLSCRAGCFDQSRCCGICARSREQPSGWSMNGFVWTVNSCFNPTASYPAPFVCARAQFGPMHPCRIPPGAGWFERPTKSIWARHCVSALLVEASSFRTRGGPFLWHAVAAETNGATTGLFDLSVWVVAVFVEAVRHGYGGCRGIPAAAHDVVLCPGQSSGGLITTQLDVALYVWTCCAASWLLVRPGLQGELTGIWGGAVCALQYFIV